MEENRLTHNIIPTGNSRKPTSQMIPAPLSLDPNNILVMNNNQTCRSPNGEGTVEEGQDDNDKVEAESRVDESGRERLKRHREEVMGRVNIPENWGQEKLLKDWNDYTTFDAIFAPHRLIVTARDALIADGRKARSQRLRIQSSC